VRGLQVRPQREQQRLVGRAGDPAERRSAAEAARDAADPLRSAPDRSWETRIIGPALRRVLSDMG
jgi:hypothetical protein